MCFPPINLSVQGRQTTIAIERATLAALITISHRLGWPRLIDDWIVHAPPAETGRVSSGKTSFGGQPVAGVTVGKLNDRIIRQAVVP